VSGLDGFAPVDGGKLYYEVAGEGPAVVLVHPGLWDSRAWDEQFGVFAQAHTVVRYDMRGYGRSDRPVGPFSFTDDLRALLEFLGIATAAIVGCSIGGGVAIEFALEHPQMVSALVLVAAGVDGFESDAMDWDAIGAPISAAVRAGDLERAVDLELEIWAPLGVTDPVGRRIREIAQDNRHELQVDWSLAASLDPKPAERLDEIGVPTLVILGADDAVEMAEIGDVLLSGISGARKVVIDGADHVVNMRQPEEFNRLVLGFLTRTA
jgi:3-oxoadipate enol-lactonase